MGLSVVNRPIRPAGLSPALRAIALAAAPSLCSRKKVTIWYVLVVV
jgi:hypothetical protein